ncbi:heat-inducible transcriptional repressor HrcA [Paramicrobacterium agarici]|uniref:Heat-inducible transcription repressor HrcA n=1 Tax=Paramicrobacterium agarici TaxID=630514 RepID=A0A2A9DZ53_9MICO|nr:heat-inducible transcriptional repressor HrcA [Microbacterium agarici]PFG31210.1 heat-inducible transcription repressor HrcA [Microbacterium agarici]TQO24312.1 heat-inducible transcription repressor HrcA [Microbacterium agarici]
MVSERSLDVLRAIVTDFVSSREPVGSKSIVDRHQFGVSAATIRNDMAQLEEEELIVAPHTSSGRIPTDKGYRLFVDQLTDKRPLSPAQRRAIEMFLEPSADLDDVLRRTVRLLSQLTNQVALVQYPSFARASVRHVELVSVSESTLLVVVIVDNGRVDQRLVESRRTLDDDEINRIKVEINDIVSAQTVNTAATRLMQQGEDDASADDGELADAVRSVVLEVLGHYREDRLVMAGAANLARTEADFSGSIFPVLEALEQQVVLLRLFGEMQADQLGVSASIGRENAPFGLDETSIVTSGYRSSAGEIARLGVLGPTRMDYAGNITAVRAVARYLTRLLEVE